MNDKTDNFSDHRKEQVLRWASTTAEQRLQFVEDALEFTYSVGIDYQETKRLLNQKQTKNLKSKAEQ